MQLWPPLDGIHEQNWKTRVNIFAVDIRPAAGCDFVLIFVRHFLFAHVRCLTLFRAGRTRLDMEAQPKCRSFKLVIPFRLIRTSQGMD